MLFEENGNKHNKSLLLKISSIYLKLSELESYQYNLFPFQFISNQPSEITAINFFKISFQALKRRK